MAAVPNTAKGGIGAGGVLVLLLVIALALGGGHHMDTATSGGSGSEHVVPHLIGTTGDPCRDKPDSEVVRTVHAPGRSNRGHVTLDCREWRAIIRRSIGRGTGGRGTIRQILACIQAAVQRGDWAQKDAIDHYAWHWGPGADDYALIVAEPSGRIALAVPGYGSATWRDCATAARWSEVPPG
jgi:hypothetical protein